MYFHTAGQYWYVLCIYIYIRKSKHESTTQRAINMKYNPLNIGVLALGVLASGSAFADYPVPEMDAGLMPVALGLTIALVMLAKDRSKK
jgi:hypothetical protein